MKVAFRRLPHAEDLAAPAYATPGAAGLDLLAAIDLPVLLKPGARALVPTGIILALPEGHEGQIRPRSGLAARHGLTVLNAPGTIDADYRGELAVILINHGHEPFLVERGMRIAQLVIAPFQRAVLTETEHLDETGRGAAGFGSTGMHSQKKTNP